MNDNRDVSKIKATRRRGAIYLSVMITGALVLGGCQEKVLVESQGALGSNVVRLGDTAVANVDGTTIYLSDVERAAVAQKLIPADTSLKPKDATFQRVLDELIDQRLMALAALRQSLDQSDEAQRRLAVSRERILSSLLVEQHLKETVTEATIRKMYDAQASLRNRGEEIRARHILVETEAEIADVVKRLAAKEEFGAVAADVSIDRASQENRGDLGYFTEDMLSGDFTDVAFALETGTTSPPFQTEFGWHVVEVTDRRKGRQPTFEDMRDEILNFMTYDEIQKLVAGLRESGDISLLFGQAVMDKPADPTLNDTTPEGTTQEMLPHE